MRIQTAVNTQCPGLEAQLETNNNTQNTEVPNEQEKDIFEKKSLGNKLTRKALSHYVKKATKKNEAHSQRLLRSGPFSMRDEEKFLHNPTVRQYYRLAAAFDELYINAYQPKFEAMDNFLIPIGQKNTKLEIIDPALVDLTAKEKKLEKWHKKHQKEFNELAHETQHKVEKRQQKIIEDGRGVGGHMTNIVGGSKATAFFTKNRLTIRGNMFQLNNQLFGKSIYEMLPRYGSRKGQHMGVRITQFGINAIITALGYSLVPVTFGISSIISSHAQTVITLSGEAIALKLDGAKKEKIISHASLRGVQLEIPKAIPIVGQIINIGENCAMGSAAFGIVSTTIADWIMSSVSDRYTSTLNIDDLGDPRVLSEFNARINYLARFLLPMGQYLLLKETRPEHQKKLRKILKEQFKTLASLEHKKTKTLNFYRVSLMAETIPFEYRQAIKEACEEDMATSKINNYKVVRRCLATLRSSTPS